MVNKTHRIIIISHTLNNINIIDQLCISQVWSAIHHYHSKILLVMVRLLNIKMGHILTVSCREVQVFKGITVWSDTHLRRITCRSKTCEVRQLLWCRVTRAYWFSHLSVNTELFLHLLWQITTCNKINNHNNNNQYHVPKSKRKWKSQNIKNQNYKI